MNTQRANEITRHVQTNRGYIWDAYDQGRWAFNMGHSRAINPHIQGHVNFSDWNRGWDEERRNSDQ